MKKTLIYTTLLLLGMGCSKNDAVPPQEGYGTLTLQSQIDTHIATRGEVASGSELTPEELSLRITGKDYEHTWATVADYTTESPQLMKGDYKVELYHGDPKKEGENLPYYHGSEQVTVVARREVTAHVKAAIANSQVVVRLTQAFSDYFHDAHFTLTTRDGGKFEFHPTTTEATTPIYVCAGSVITLSGEASRQAGDRVTFAPQKLDPTVARTRHTFVFDAKNAGHATVTITLDDSETQTHDLVFELNGNA